MPSARFGRRDLPEARVVTPGGTRSWLPAESLAEHVERKLAPLKPHLEVALSVLVGLWPLVAVVLMSAAFIWGVGYSGAAHPMP